MSDQRPACERGGGEVRGVGRSAPSCGDAEVCRPVAPFRPKAAARPSGMRERERAGSVSIVVKRMFSLASQLADVSGGWVPGLN